MSDNRRVVITGCGAVSSVGNSVPAMWNALINGRSGLARITLFDPTPFKTQVAGEVKNLDLTGLVNPKDERHMDRFVKFAIAAYEEARVDAGLPADLRGEDSPVDPTRAGCCIGSGIGGIQTIAEQSIILNERGPGRVSPFLIPNIIANMASGVVAIRSGAMAPNFAVVSACASGAHAIGESFEMIRRGAADLMFTGGSEASVCELSFAGFCAMKAMSMHYNESPEEASRPFEKNRDGFVMCEGAGILVLEEYEHAKARGAHIIAEMVGYGATCDAHHITAPEPSGLGCIRAYEMALKEAGIAPEEVDYINAHGTGTHLNDSSETAAIKRVFGDHAYKLSVSSTKGAMGHGLGAAGGFETIVAAKTIETGIIPPTLNYVEPDPECDLDYTPNTAAERKVNVAINTNLGFGGHNGVIVLRKI